MTDSARTAALFTALLALSLLPLLFFTHLPFQDYPNHLARAYIMAHQDHDILSQFYRINWAFIPNLTGDLVLWMLVEILPAHVAGKVFVALIFVLLAGGVFHLQKTLHGAITPAAFLIFLLLYNAALAQGFLNFLLAIGLCFHALALWVRLADKGLWRHLFGLAAAFVLLLSHLYAFGFFLLFLFCLENRPLWEKVRPWRAAFWRHNLRFLPLLVLPLIPFVLFSPTGAHDVSDFVYSPLIAKWALAFFGLLYTYHPAVSVLTVTAICWMLVRARRPGRADALLILGVAFIVYMVLPHTLMSAANADWRFMLPVFMFVIALLPVTLEKKRHRLFLGIIVMLVILQQAATLHKWRQSEAVYRDFQTVTADLPDGARVFPALIDSEEPALDWPLWPEHIFSYLVIDKHAFVPSMFAGQAQQVLSFAPPYDEQRVRLRGQYGVVPTRYVTADTFMSRLPERLYDYAVIIADSPPAVPNFPAPGRVRGYVYLYRLAPQSGPP